MSSRCGRFLAPREAGELAQQLGRRDRTGTQGGYEPDDLVPVVTDEIGAHLPRDDGLQGRVRSWPLEAEQHPLVEVANAWRKAISEEVAEGKDVVAGPARIGVMLADCQRRLVVQ